MHGTSLASAPAPRRGRGRPSADDAQPVSAQLLDAATTLFAEAGFDTVGVRQIAAQAHVDAAMISHHFGSKRALWEAVIDRLSTRLTGCLANVVVLPGTPAARLNQAIGHIIDLLCDTPPLAAFILREVVLENERSDFCTRRLVEPIHQSLRPLLADYAAFHGSDVDLDYLFVALNGAIVVSVAARPLLDRIAGAKDDAAFRAHLKTTLAAQMATRLGA